MIPLRLKLSGFLSYRDPVEVDFRGFDLACISGQNGAGKSSLLDAMTWALFGQARKKNESLINLQSKTAEVVFTFEYESNQYRVTRSLTRGKTTMVEFWILEVGVSTEIWRPLTEHTLRETEARIERVLRLDYDTFINVSFFLQGHADQFAQQAPTRRKEILGNILGLEIWDVYKERASQHRSSLETDLNSADGILKEIDTELAEEGQRKQRLAELGSELKKLETSRKTQENVLESINQIHAGLEKQRDQVQRMVLNLEQAGQRLDGLNKRFIGRVAEQQKNADLLSRAAKVESAYFAWKEARLDLENWGKIANQFNDQAKRRTPFLDVINAEKATLEQEKRTLEDQANQVTSNSAQLEAIQVDLNKASKEITNLEEKIARKADADAEKRIAMEKRDQLFGENKTLLINMQDLDNRIKKLQATEGASCPLCGQSLTAEHRQSTIDQLNADGTVMGDRHRSNTSSIKELDDQIRNFDLEIKAHSSVENDLIRVSSIIAQLTERQATLQNQVKEWDAKGARRIAKVTQMLAGEKYALVARKNLAKVDKELTALGYDAEAHEKARQNENEGRSAEADFRNIEVARGTLKPLDDEIANLRSEIKKQEAEAERLSREQGEAAATLKAAENAAPDQETAENTLIVLKEQETQFNQEVGAARQKVTVLDELRKRRDKLEAEQINLRLQISRYKTLERAFGKDGVPALLIEQALPEIEMKANEILGRLSDDSMHLHFETQAKYKDEKRKDLRETLEIQVSDGVGERDYEMFSGGEAFRVNFAIRLALSEVLAQRKGSRLQMLVIDEGFGSQDSLGRQRLIQAINAVHADFSKILVITHLDELKDAFPTRIEVEKTEIGSTVTVI